MHSVELPDYSSLETLLVSVKTNLGHLTSLSLEGMNNVHNGGLQVLSYASKLLHKLHRVHILTRLRWILPTNICFYIQYILRHLCELTHLNVSCCNELTDRAFLIDDEHQLTIEAYAKVPPPFHRNITCIPKLCVRCTIVMSISPFSFRLMTVTHTIGVV